MIKNIKIISLFSLSLTIIIIGAITVYVGLGSETGPFIIHFDSQREDSLVGGIEVIYGILAVAGVIAAINFCLANAVYEREKQVSFILAVATLVLSVLVFIAVRRIILMN